MKVVCECGCVWYGDTFCPECWKPLKKKKENV